MMGIKLRNESLLLKALDQFAVAIGLLILISPAVAQQKQPQAEARDFGGTWILDKSQSTPGVSQFGKTKLKISYRDPKLKITRILEMSSILAADVGKITSTEPIEDFVYYTDTRGEKNRSVFDPTVSLSGIRTSTAWEGDKIIVRSSDKQSRSQMDTTETWELSPDGKALTETTTIVLTSHTLTTRSVFNRLEK
jgi:hypothetical protein